MAVIAWFLLGGPAGVTWGADRNLSTTRVGHALSTVRFVAYTPRSFAVADGVPRAATAAGVAEDLQLLRPYFDGLVTYSVTEGHERIAALAEALGFRAIILGVWDPTNAAELESAIRLARAHTELALAVCLGNEGLYWKRYTWDQLRLAMAKLRAALPGVAITTSEPFAVYLDDPPNGFGEAQDLLLPNIHPIFEPWFRPQATDQAVEFVANVVGKLQQRYAKPVLVKETGLPSGPPESGFSEVRQAAFWRSVAERLPASPDHAVASFEAFDAPWKPAASPESALRASEAHWGLMDAAGRPKAAFGIRGEPGHAAAPRP